MAIQYTKSEGVSIGYAISSEGDQSIIYVPGAYSNLAIERYFPESVAWEKFLGRVGRIINFDKRATGVSDRSARPLNLDQQVVDVEAIRVATDSEELIVCGLSQGAPLAVLYALAYPERVRALILMEGVCCDAKDPYASLAFTQYLKDNDIRISMDGKGAWRDNVFVERLWRTVKYEHVYLHAYESTSEAKSKIGHYFEFYNQRRPYSKLDRLTPDQFYYNSLPSKEAA